MYSLQAAAAQVDSRIRAAYIEWTEHDPPAVQTRRHSLQLVNSRSHQRRRSHRERWNVGGRRDTSRCEKTADWGQKG